MSVFRIEAIDLFLLQVPDFDPDRDSVRDTLLIRARAGQYEGWGECEAAPFVSLAAFITPESHSTCRPVSASVLGQRLEDPADIAAITRQVFNDSMNVLQAPHVYSGVEMALWDLLGKTRQEPVYRLLGYDKAFSKLPYVVVPFASTPSETFRRMQAIRQMGYRAVKTGWNGFGGGDIAIDQTQLAAAREGFGTDGHMFLDAARVWESDIAAAKRYCTLLDQFAIEWVEEPFDPAALDVYAEFARHHGCRRVAAGENIHSIAEARQLLDIAGIGILQIDCGRIGGIGAATEIARYTEQRGAAYVNHTYTSHLALSAALQSFAGLERHNVCEYPIDTSSLSWAICQTHLSPDADGRVSVPEAPGLGIAIDLYAVQRYVTDLEIKIGHSIVYRTPSLL